MDRLIEYKIPYKGLSEGQYVYNFNIDGQFFKAVESEELSVGNINVVMCMDKQSRMLVLDFDMQGTLEVDCDRCGYEVLMPINVTKKLIAKYHNDGSDSEDILFLDEKDSTLDVSNIIYELIILSLPMRRVHKDGDCNEEQLKMLENLHHTKHEDARWDALKNLKKDSN